MNKGVVMEVSHKSIIVMTPSGSFERIPAKNRSCQVGEEIVYAARPAGMRQPAFAAMSVFVAAVVFCMMLFTGIPAVFADKSVVAYVSIDINPSLEIGLDKQEKVRELRGLNEKGLELVRDVSYRGKPLEEVADKLLQKVEEMKIFEAEAADIIIASTMVKNTASLSDESVSEHLKQQVLAHVVTKHPEKAEKFEVAAFTAPAEIRGTAKENGLSIGKYSVYLNAKSSGHDVKVEDLKKESVHNLAKEAGGIDKLVDASKLKKDTIEELLKEGKNGKLDKKVQDKKKEEEKKNTSSKPSGKASATPNKASVSPSKMASPTPTPKPSVKPAEASKSPDSKKTDDKKTDDKNDDKNDSKKDDNKNSNGKTNGDNKDDTTGKTGSSSGPSPSSSGSGNGNGKDDKVKQDNKDQSKATPSKDEDRKTSGPSADSKSAAPKQNEKEDKSGKDNKNDNKKEN